MDKDAVQRARGILPYDSTAETPAATIRRMRDGESHYQDGGDMAMRNQGRWYLWRNLSESDEDDTWATWHVSVPDTGQGGEAALRQLLAAVQDARS